MVRKYQMHRLFDFVVMIVLVFFPLQALAAQSSSQLVLPSSQPVTKIKTGEKLANNLGHILKNQQLVIKNNPIAKELVVQNQVRAATISFGQTVTGSITTAGQVITYTFTANAGDIILACLSDNSNYFDPQVKLYGPDGSLMNSNWSFSDHTELTLSIPASGTYTVEASDNGGNDTAGFGLFLQRLNNPGNAGLLPFGQTAAGAISLLGEMDTFTFTASAGDMVIVGMSEDNNYFDPEVRLYDPNGSLLNSNWSSNDHAEFTQLLSSAGSYTILGSDNGGTDAAGYGLFLQRLNNPGNASLLPFGQTATGSIATLGEMKTYTFTASIGDVVLVGMSDASNYVDPEVRLYDPDGSQLNSNWSSGEHAEFTQLLSLPGCYTILAGDNNGNDTASFGLFLQRLNNPGNAVHLPFGETATGAISLFSEMHTFTFTASAGDVVLLGTSDANNFFDPEVRLFGPDGSLLDSNWSSGDHAEFTNTLSSSGNYTILAGDNGGTDAAGYGLFLQRLNNPGNASLLPFGQTAAGTISHFSEMHTYTFTASAGDTVLLGMSDASNFFDPEVRLFGPDGSLIDSNWSSGEHAEFTHTLSSSGSYTILVGDYEGTDVAGYGLFLQRLNNPGNDSLLPFGETATGTISLLAEMHTFTFTASAGDTVLLGMSDASNFFDPEVRLFGPDGSLIDSNWSSGDHAEFTHALSSSGNYTILVGDDGGTDTAGYGLFLQRLNNPGNVTPYSFGQTYAGAISSLAETQTYTFTAGAGDVVLVSMSDTNTLFDPEVRLYGPDGSLVNSNLTTGGHTEFTHTLSLSGNYTVLAGDHEGTDTASYGLFLQRLNDPGNAVPLYSSKTASGSIAALAEMDSFTFTAAAEGVAGVQVRRISGNLDPEVRLYAPDGSLLAYDWDYSQVTITDTSITFAGTHTLLIGDYGSTETGAYTVSVTLIGPINLALGQVYTSQIQDLETQFFTVGVEDAGQQLLVQVTPLNGIDGLWVDSRFGALPLSGRYDDRTLEPTVQGTYEILISSSQSGTYYLKVLGRAVSQAGGTYRISVSGVDRYLSNLDPRSGGNSGQVTLNLSGLGFVEGITVELRSASHPTIAAEEVTLASPTNLWALVDLNGTPTGVYDVCAVWPDAGEKKLSDTFTITTGKGAQLEAHLSAPGTIRPGRQYVLWLDYANTGDADMTAPLFVIESGQSMKVFQYAQYQNYDMRVLGLGTKGPAGLLRPGDAGRIPIYFLSPQTVGPVTFNLQVITSTTEPVDWDSLEPYFRPEGIDQAEWDTIWTSVKENMGSSWGEILDKVALTATQSQAPLPEIYSFDLIFQWLVVLYSDPSIADELGRQPASPQFAEVYDPWGDVQVVSQGPFDPTRPTYIITHGNNNTGDETAFNNLAGHISDLGNVNVIRIKWPQGAKGILPWPKGSIIPQVAEAAYSILNSQYPGIDFSNTTFIGHSFGNEVNAQVSQKAGSVSKGLILDPAMWLSGAGVADFRDSYAKSWAFITDSLFDAKPLTHHVADRDIKLETPSDWGNLQMHGYGLEWLDGRITAGDLGWLLFEKDIPDAPLGFFSGIARMDGSYESTLLAVIYDYLTGDLPLVLQSLTSFMSNVIRPIDPNEKVGPEGTGAGQVVGVDDELYYTIYFENIASATAPAQEVFVTDLLDPNLDWNTFQVTEIAFGDHEIAVSEQTNSYYSVMSIPDYRPEEEKSWLVEATTEVDYPTGQAAWTLRTLDPLTGELTEDPLAGLLPPNDETGRGEGHVTFSIKPKTGIPVGIRITNTASIVFDTNDPITTNEVWNTIGYQIFLPLVVRNS